MDKARVAWLLTVAPFYWHPILAELTRLFPQTTLFTAGWTEFAKGYEDSFMVEVVGERKVIKLTQTSQGYYPSVMYLSPSIVSHLLRFKPDVIFADGFCIWTILALVLKAWGKWRVVVMCDGSSPTVDYRNSATRLCLRRILAQFVDAFITNNQAGKAYLVEVVRAKENIVFAQPYLVPDVKALLQQDETANIDDLQLQRPIFLFMGQIIPRKGLHELLEACYILKNQGYRNYSLLIVGDGWQRQELEILSKTYSLEAHVRFVGKVEYSHLGAYLRHADVFVFPTLEDVWGMVVPEALAFGKPILCSQWAGAAELVVEGENGYCFEPRDPQRLAELISRFINNPQLIASMGHKSQQLMTPYTPEIAAKFVAEVTAFVLDNLT